jgi:hypothetical protein
MWSQAWPHLRTVLIAYHVAAVLLTCTPPPGQVIDKSRWKSPAGQAQFRKWSDRLGTSPEKLEAWLWARGESYAAVRRVLLRPFRGYVDGLRLDQGWALFTNPQRNPAQLEVELHTPGHGWRWLTSLRSGVFDWKREQLDNHRLRKLVGRIARRQRPHIYDRLVRWLAREAAREFPEADRLRVQLFRFHTNGPGASPRLSNGRFTDVRVFDLETYR